MRTSKMPFTVSFIVNGETIATHHRESLENAHKSITWATKRFDGRTLSEMQVHIIERKGSVAINHAYPIAATTSFRALFAA